VAALTGPCGPAEEILHQLHARRKLLVDGLSRLPGVRCATPRGAFYAYPDVSELLERMAITTDALASRLLEQGVATLSGTAFGNRGDGFLRLSFGASPKVIAEALTGIRHCVALNTKPEPSLP
jgi:aspartate/methionine/tyrosine aminotransferase